MGDEVKKLIMDTFDITEDEYNEITPEQLSFIMYSMEQDKK